MILTPYLTAAFGIGIIWLVVFALLPRLRSVMLLTGLIVCPLVAVDYFTTPSYWTPQTLGNIPVGVEAFIFTFFLAGIASVIYELIGGRLASSKRIKLHLDKTLLLLPGFMVALIAYVVSGLNIIFLIIFCLLAVCGSISLYQKGFFPHIVVSALIFGIFYFLAFSFWQVLAPQSYYWWNLGAVYGLSIGRVPLGEVLFGFAFGAGVGPLYEFLIRKRPSVSSHP